MGRITNYAMFKAALQMAAYRFDSELSAELGKASGQNYKFCNVQSGIANSAQPLVLYLEIYSINLLFK